MQESGIRMSSKPVQRSKLLADSCPPWQGIYLDMKRRAGLYTPATRNGFTNSLGNGLAIFAYTRTTSSVAPSEKTIIGLCILTKKALLTSTTKAKRENELRGRASLRPQREVRRWIRKGQFLVWCTEQNFV